MWVSVALLSGCRESPDSEPARTAPAESKTSTPLPPLAPVSGRSDGYAAQSSTQPLEQSDTKDIRDTVENMRDLLSDKQYARLASWIAPALREETIKLLMSTDELFSANDDLQAELTRKGGYNEAWRWDISRLKNNRGVFSETVELVDVVITGDQAELYLQIGHRLPLETTHLVREGEQWLLQPESPIEGLNPLIEELTAALRAVQAELRGRTMSNEDLKSLLGERVTPVLERIRGLRSSSSSARAPGV